MTRRFSPSTARNREPILAVLQRVLPERGDVLEIASGAGEHAIFFAGAMPGLTWRPSDPDPDSRESIAAWIAHETLSNVHAPLAIDACTDDWGVAGPFDAIVSINMVHIAPWASAVGLFAGAGRLLKPDGILFLYGPFMLDGQHTAPSNAAFDASLKSRDPSWGIRDLADLERLAADNGLRLRERVEMPANNQSLVFAKRE
jgi:cyclopropane fatty-acyl-phospholipid synthase-like methyltransferase